MEFSVIPTINTKTAVLIVPVFQDIAVSKTGPKLVETYLKKREEQKDFEGKEGEILLGLPDEENLPHKIVLWGLGEKKKLNSQKLRELSALVIKAVRTLKKGEATLWCPDALLDFSQALGEGLTFGNFTLAKFKTGKEKEELELQTIKKVVFVTAKKTQKFETELQKGRIVAEAVGEVRDLVNAGPTLKNVDYLAGKAQAIAKQNGYKINVLNKRDIEKLGMNGILGVNRGSELGAKMVVIEHTPKGTGKDKPIIIVGKGIIFDSGGYNLKPSSSLFEMQLDMAGAGAVMGLFMLLKKLNVQQHVVGIIPLTDNALNAKSQKPSDIVTTYSGKTVEIVNTDAEGRMILCDAITYALKHFEPRYLIDIATLTGACMVALGDRYAGLFGNDNGLIEKLRKAGELTDELSWQLPIHPDHREKMKSKIADLRNWDEIPHAGASKAAAFLQEFVEDAKWVHIDIAGTAFVKNPKKYESPMGTGFGVRLLLEFLEKLR
jgi:leucyl aminopeptidase